MGLLREGINEIIATTKLNAAPMGIRCKGKDLSMSLFLGSHTADNVKKDGWIVANIVHDPVCYVKTAFMDLDPFAFAQEQINGNIVYRLCVADGWGLYTTSIRRETSNQMTVHLLPVKEVILSSVPYPVNRGFNSIIEASIHGTRYRMNRDKHLKDLIMYHARIIRKCGGKREREALELLMKFIE